MMRVMKDDARDTHKLLVGMKWAKKKWSRYKSDERRKVYSYMNGDMHLTLKNI